MFSRADGATALREDLVEALALSSEAVHLETEAGAVVGYAGVASVWNGQKGFVAVLIRHLDPVRLERFTFSEPLLSEAGLSAAFEEGIAFAEGFGFAMDAPAFRTLRKAQRQRRLECWNDLRKLDRVPWGRAPGKAPTPEAPAPPPEVAPIEATPVAPEPLPEPAPALDEEAPVLEEAEPFEDAELAEVVPDLESDGAPPLLAPEPLDELEGAPLAAESFGALDEDAVAPEPLEGAIEIPELEAPEISPRRASPGLARTAIARIELVRGGADAEGLSALGRLLSHF